MRFPSALAVYLPVAAAAFAADAAPALERRFTRDIQPFLKSYCMGCHGNDKPAAQFDLKPYTSLAPVVRDHQHWGHILDRVSASQMPPKGMKQPPPAEREKFVQWIRDVRNEEARKNAGDPGPVTARRLSNAEYDYTIRDLTGVDLRPTREFPVDPANTEGFDNSAESLTMSPALLNKYLQAARHVADNLVLTPDGFDFSPHPMLVETDREKYAIQRIVNFYFAQPTDYADYFEASWRFKHRAALGQPRATLSSIAAERKISAKYLPMVWQILEEKSPAAEVGPVAKLQSMWQALPAPTKDANPALRAQCEAMRDYVKKIRKVTAREFRAPVVQGLSPTSQPLMNWKFRQFNTHRRDFDRAALRLASEPPLTAPNIPRYPGLGRESADRAAALMLKSRVGVEDLVIPDGQRERYEASFARLANVFPDVFFVSERGRFFPDDSQDKGRFLSAGYHNVMGYWRDDDPLQELILDDAGIARLNRLWDEFDYIGDHTARTWVQYYFNQSGEIDGRGRESGSFRPSDTAVSETKSIFDLRELYLKKAESVNASEVAKEAIKYHFQWVNDTLRRVEKMRVDSRPLHLNALVRFAERAYRRPLAKAEKDGVLAYYQTLRDKNSLTHEEAIRDSVVSILMSPNFTYRLDLTDTTGKPNRAGRLALTSNAVANRLSYFLWGSLPDAELLSRDLRNPAVLRAQARRLLKDERARALATEFGGNWLDFRRFETISSVDRTRFPSFNDDLRQAMFEEPVRFLEDVIRNDRPVLDLLYANYTFVNGPLAKHYGMPDTKEWTRVDNAREYGRGGLLPMAAFLTQNSPGLRTSPVKRGYWVVRRVLGEVIPPPPPSVPELPADEAKSDLPLRAMLAKHREIPACAACHARFDSYGLVFEGYGPIGEKRQQDLAGRPVDATAEFPGGQEGNGLEGVQAYIRQHREKEFLNTLNRKLLAFALGRSLQLSDEPLIEKMNTAFASGGNRLAPVVDTIVTSEQFLYRRSKDQEGN